MLTHYQPLAETKAKCPISIPPENVLTFSGGIEIEHWAEMGLKKQTSVLTLTGKIGGKN